MKVLWITNILLPEATALLTGNKEQKGSGGWLVSSASALVESGEVDLCVASVSARVDDLTILKGKDIVYYILPQCNSIGEYERQMRIVNEKVCPNIVHIHGTEWPYGLAYVNVCGADNVLISVQGVMSEIAKCYTDGLSSWQILMNVTIRDLRLKTILGEKADYLKRAALEQDVLRKVRHVIGRTSFDHDYVMSVNPSLEYHFCNESLREEFYDKEWRYETCVPHTIFLSQANYPIKGLHQMMRALPAIREKYPDVKVHVAGTDITKHSTLSDIIKYSGYGKIIYRLIRKYALESIVSFTGLLSAEKMVSELLQSNLYVCPSSCENSSNSIAEAQILGVPCLASRRGGNPDMIPNNYCGQLFDFDDVEELTHKVCEMFETTKSFDNSAVRTMATKRHDKVENLKTTITVYQTVMNKQ